METKATFFRTQCALFLLTLCICWQSGAYFAHANSLVVENDHQPQSSELISVQPLTWTSDILINDPDLNVGKPSMAIAPNGDIYVVVKDLTLQWFYIYRSTDGGYTWSYLNGLTGGISGFATFNPAIAYAENYLGEKWLYVVYEAKQPDGSRDVEVLRFQPDDIFNTFAFSTIDSNIFMPSASDRIRPEICTDFPTYSDFSVYVTYHRYGGIDPAYQVMFARSDNFGQTWTTPKVLAQVSTNTQVRPDITFGGPLGFPGDAFRLFVVYESVAYVAPNWRHNVFVRISRDFGNNWDPAVQLTTSTDDEYEPRVAAAVGDTAVVVVYTRDWSNSGDLDIRYAYSTNAGVNWTTDQWLASSLEVEKSPNIHIYSSQRFHCAYWKGWDIHYTWADNNAPTSWTPAIIINEQNWASSAYSRPSVCVDPMKSIDEQACIAWTDYRGINYGVYFDTACAVIGDFNFNCCVDWLDLDIFASRWLQPFCSAPDWCGGADLNTSGTVNSTDFSMFSGHWLDGCDP